MNENSSFDSSSRFAHKGEEEAWKTLKDVIDIPGHLEFIRNLAERPEVPEEVRATALHRMKTIDEKQKDRTINLCVVGGAGSSKSAFINALSGEEILTSSAIADSAVVPVIVEYLSSPAIFIQDSTGRYTLEQPEDMAVLNRRLTEIATDQSLIGKISLIRVGIPSAALKEGLRIIDTPAYTTSEAWERPVTQELVKDYADLCIILTPAIQALSQDSMEFIGELPTMLVRNAMAVATHIEHVSEKEIEDIRRFVAKKFRDRFDVEIPVMAVASSSRTGAAGDMTGERMMHLTRSAVSEIRSRALKGRHHIQARRMVRLVNSLYDALTESVRGERANLESDLVRIEKIRKVPLDPIVEAAKREHLSSLRSLAALGRRAYVDFLNRCVDKNVNGLIEAINSPGLNSLDKLKTFLNEGFKTQCTEMTEEMKRVTLRFRDDMRLTITADLKETHRTIREQFRHVNILDFRFAATSYDFNIENPETSLGVVNCLNHINKLNDTLGNGLMGGMVTGAIVGQVVIPVPVLGAILGGIVGFIGGGSLFDPDMKKVKAKIVDDLTPKLRVYFRDVSENVRAQLEQVSENATKSLTKGIDEYLLIYKEGIDNEIKSLNRRRIEVEQKIAETDSLIRSLATRRRKIEHAAASI